MTWEEDTDNLVLRCTLCEELYTINAKLTDYGSPPTYYCMKCRSNTNG